MTKHSAYILALTMVLSSFSAHAGGEVQPRGARSAGIGNSSVMLEGIWGGFNNQAGLLAVNGLNSGVYYHNMFFVDGLGNQGLTVAYGMESQAFAISYSSFGIDAFSEDKVGLAYAMDLGDKLDFGVQLNYHSTRIQFDEYGNRSSLTAEISFLSHLSDELTIGFRLFNPSQTQLNEFEDERIPTVLSLGGGYEFNDKVSLVSEVVKDIDKEPIVRAGIEYRVVPTVFLRGGVSTEPTMSSFGAGIDLGALDVDLAASYHHTLGYSTQISLSYSFSHGEVK